eukprot:CAMPEP_0197067528 /NCGR_PEP_ID=MMETSP1384-20130603/180739_1 /TAXON_ID=29189 /ORGANISM="Ammonia sp." /LENGTH=235 /DNA_ID=CAMNT_0042505009 /DNA_START=1 /DNA_END=705 /DNA_ORIENTATION=+
MKEPPLIPVAAEKIAYWHDSVNERDYAICCTGHEMFSSQYKSGVYLYDLNTLQLQFLCSYPDNSVWPTSMGMAIDGELHKLHLFGGKGLFGQWLVLNLKANLWDVRKDLSKYKIPFPCNLQQPKCIVINGSLHVFSKGTLLRYARRKHRFVELPSIQGADVRNLDYMFYVQSQRRIYVFGGSNDSLDRVYYDDIWYCEHSKSGTEYKWHRFNIQLPYHEKNDAYGGKRKYSACLA